MQYVNANVVFTGYFKISALYVTLTVFAMYYCRVKYIINIDGRGSPDATIWGYLHIKPHFTLASVFSSLLHLLKFCL